MASASRTRVKRRGAKQAPAPGVRGFGLLFLAIIASTMMFALPAFLILVAAAIPPLVAYYVDRENEKYAAVAVGALSIAGGLPYILDLWLGKFTIRESILILSDPYTWLVMYGAAAGGWLLFFIMPIVALTYLKFTSEHQMNALRKECQVLAKEWGSAIEPRPIADPNAPAEAKPKA